jgi:hypothetical protein
MVTVADLTAAQPRLWREAADDAVAASRHCQEVAGFARDDVVRTLRANWAVDAGTAATEHFARQADDYEAAGLALRGLAAAYDRLAEAVEAAKRTLEGARDFAAAHQITISASGEVVGPHVSGAEAAAVSAQVSEVATLVREALDAAGAADEEAAAAIRTIGALPSVTTPAAVREALARGGDNPLAIALRLRAGTGGPHPINVSADQLAAVRAAAAETGVSEQVLLAILWQEQQWYQEVSGYDSGPLAWLGRLGDLAANELKDKSLGIIHMKLAAARMALAQGRRVFTVNGRFLGDLSDEELAEKIEADPNFDIRLSAYYLQYLKSDPHGAGSDKQLFLLCAADDRQMRDNNARYGDDTGARGGEIHARAQNWDLLRPHLRDAQAWAALSDAQRADAMRQLTEGVSPRDGVSLHPVYAPPGTVTKARGTAPEPPGRPPPPPGVPGPRPGPWPTAPIE